MKRWEIGPPWFFVQTPKGCMDQADECNAGGADQARGLRNSVLDLGNAVNTAEKAIPMNLRSQAMGG